jgi:uncharacterized protein YndB with AHSA1/START domain
MTNFSITVDIQASPDRVFAVLCDIERWPEWTSTVTSVRRMDGGPFAVGSRVRVCQPKLLPAVWQVTEMDEGRRMFTWVTRSPGVQVTGRHQVEENQVEENQVEENGSRSRATLSLEFSGLLGPLVARFYRSLNERYLAIEAKGLKERSEG